MLLLDTGARRAEMVGLKLTDVDPDLDVLLVLGKGRRERTLPFGRKAGEALDRYLRARARHKDSVLSWLWLGKKGRLTEWGLVQMLRRRGAQAGLPGLHPHQLRHTFAHEWLAQGGAETDLCRSRAGSRGRCCSGTAHQPPTPAPGRHTVASPPMTGCRQPLAPSSIGLTVNWRVSVPAPAVQPQAGVREADQGPLPNRVPGLNSVVSGALVPSVCFVGACEDAYGPRPCSKADR